ncbi:MAG: hypothetical protein WD768_09340 [Phycisphaeraceae bacterium]
MKSKLACYVAFSLILCTLAFAADEPKLVSGLPAEPKIDPGWKTGKFPEHAICYKTPDEIAAIYGKLAKRAVTSFDKPTDGSLRIIGTGHSFMAPAYGTLPAITRAAGFQQAALFTHTGGGVTGSARYKWEQENGIYQFDGKPVPKLLASLAGAEWDVMTWSPFPHDDPAYYQCWIDFALKTNPKMKFYMMNGWPQIGQLAEKPMSEEALSARTIARMGEVKQESIAALIAALNKKYPGKVFVLPTCEAMVLAAQYFHEGKLPGVEGIHTLVGKKERSLWRDQIGHLGPGFERLEGYVFFATLYGRSPEKIEGDAGLKADGYPSRELDRVFRKIAWQAVISSPMSGVKDEDGDGVGD